MGMWNDTCQCIDENWKALKARIQASITGITVNGVTHYQTDGTGICDLGEIEGTTDANEIFLKDGRSVETAIVTIDTALPGKVIDVEPSAVTGGINLNETDGNGTTARMLIRADDTLKFDGLNVGISEATDARITQAQADATTAGTKADDAQADADDAMTAANKAIVNINTAMEITDDYLKYALHEDRNNGVTGKTSLFAVDRADLNMIDVSDTFPILQLSDDAKTKINGAISAIGASVVDTALEMNIDKADGSTATEQLFSIGDGLEWVEGVLKSSISSPEYLTSFNPSTADNGVYIIKTSTMSQLRVLNSYFITTGSYGGEIHPDSVSYLLTNNVSLITPSVFSPTILLVKYSNILFAAIADVDIWCKFTTMSIKVSVDGADATWVKASVGIPRTNGEGSVIFGNSIYGSCPATIVYEGMNCQSVAGFTIDLQSNNFYGYKIV